MVHEISARQALFRHSARHGVPSLIWLPLGFSPPFRADVKMARRAKRLLQIMVRQLTTLRSEEPYEL
jgi:hypothetical protein